MEGCWNRNVKFIFFRHGLFLLLQSVVVAKSWIVCEYNTKALNLSMRLSRKHEVVAKA